MKNLTLSGKGLSFGMLLQLAVGPVCLMVLTTAGTPRPVIDRLNAALNAVMALPEVGAPLLEMGMSPMTSTPEGFVAQADRVREVFGPMALEAARAEK